MSDSLMTINEFKREITKGHTPVYKEYMLFQLQRLMAAERLDELSKQSKFKIDDYNFVIGRLESFQNLRIDALKNELNRS